VGGGLDLGQDLLDQRRLADLSWSAHDLDSSRVLFQSGGQRAESPPSDVRKSLIALSDLLNNLSNLYPISSLGITEPYAAG